MYKQFSAAASAESAVHLTEFLPDPVGVVQMSAVFDDERAVIRHAGDTVKPFDLTVGVENTGQGENGIFCAGGDDQLPGRDESGEIAHLKILPDAGDVVAHAVLHGGDRRFVGADRTGRRGGGDAGAGD